MARIVVTGGSGYVGAVLLPKLVSSGHTVVNYDIGWFGHRKYPMNSGIQNVSADIRDIDHFEQCVKGADIVLHLACVSNDSSFELNPLLSKQINFDAFEPLVATARHYGVKRFIYCSTSSVYGVSDEVNVTEDHPLVPLTDYNKYKGMCEPILFEYTNDDFVGVIIRPATLCGPSPRLRLDLTANMFTAQAFYNRKITVFGGAQMRPNLHIEDMCNAYLALINADSSLIQRQIFNCGMNNMEVARIADLVAGTVRRIVRDRVDVEIQDGGADKRSYHINSRKINSRLGFYPRYTVHDAALQLATAFKDGMYPDAMTDDFYRNVVRLKRLGVT